MNGDCCSAEALVMVAKGQLTLEFCGHHFTKHEVALAITDWHVIEDTRASLWPELARLKG